MRKGVVTYPEGFNPVARDLISKILVLNPDERYTTAQIKSNRFFNQIDWDRVQTMKVISKECFCQKTLIFDLI